MDKFHKNEFINKSIKRLNLIDTSKNGPLLCSLHHFNLETGKLRQKRVERRSNIIIILRMILPTLDLETFGWGKFYTDHKGEINFYTKGIKHLCKETGLTDKTTRRALFDLQKCGYLKVERREAIGKDGDKYRIYSLRKLTNKFFIELGFQKKTIERTKGWKRKENEIKFVKSISNEVSKKGLERLRDVLGNVGNKVRGNIQKSINSFIEPVKPFTEIKKRLSPAETQNLLHRASSIAEKTGRNPMDVYSELISHT